MPEPAPSGPAFGDWVLVYGQVMEPTSGVHPDDLVVEFLSHNEQWRGHVERRRIRPLSQQEDLPGFIYRCTHLTEYGREALVRCTLHDGHSERHRSVEGHHWESDVTVGYFEQR